MGDSRTSEIVWERIAEGDSRTSEIIWDRSAEVALVHPKLCGNGVLEGQ